MPASVDQLLFQAKNDLGNGAPRRALAVLARLLAIDPDHPIGLLMAGRAALSLSDLPRALAWFSRLTRVAPEDAEGWISLAAARRKSGELQGAEAALRIALELAPGHAGALNNFGNLLSDLDRLGEAADAYRSACAADPDLTEATRSLAGCLRDMGALTEADEAFRRLREANDDADLRFGHATTLLAMGDYAQGWPLYESRLQIPDLKIDQIPGHRWAGEPGPGAVLVVHGEQGFGDMLQFLRYLPHVKQRWRGTVALVVQRPLMELAKSIAGVDEVYTEGMALPGYHRQIPIMSLGGLFGTPPENDLSEGGYVTVSLQHRHQAAAMLPPQRIGAKRIGLVWRGRPTHLNDARRSIPLETLSPLFTLPGIDWVGLTPAPHVEDAPWLDRLHDLGGFLDAFTVTAALVKELDAVVSIDSAVAHLAGAMDVPCHVLLPVRPDWRWEVERTDSRWYKSVTLYRQTTPGDWSRPIAELAKAIDAGAQAA